MKFKFFLIFSLFFSSASKASEPSDEKKSTREKVSETGAAANLGLLPPDLIQRIIEGKQTDEDLARISAMAETGCDVASAISLARLEAILAALREHEVEREKSVAEYLKNRTTSDSE